MNNKRKMEKKKKKKKRSLKVVELLLGKLSRLENRERGAGNRG
jgi:hypothetical protein